MTITGPDARSAAPGQAVVDAAMLVLERMGLTPADLLAAPAARPVGFRNLVIFSDLEQHGWAGDCHAARSYSWISPPRTLWRRIRAAARSVTGAVRMSLQSGGRRFLARCGRCWL